MGINRKLQHFTQKGELGNENGVMIRLSNAELPNKQSATVTQTPYFQGLEPKLDTFAPRTSLHCITTKTK